MEATGRIEHDAAIALCAAGLSVMVIHPPQARRFGEAAAYLSKTDAIDARCLAMQAYYLYHTDQRERLFMRLPTEEPSPDISPYPYLAAGFNAYA
ncbi:MAG: transposase [Candidatus Accumulibacter sp.]|jgi:transposase|nr:transposase [Accumulibacter sp.]